MLMVNAEYRIRYYWDFVKVDDCAALLVHTKSKALLFQKNGYYYYVADYEWD